MNSVLSALAGVDAVLARASICLIVASSCIRLLKRFSKHFCKGKGHCQRLNRRQGLLQIGYQISRILDPD